MAVDLAAQDCKLSAISVPGDINDSQTAKKHEKAAHGMDSDDLTRNWFVT
jgi:hypothetical protein